MRHYASLLKLRCFAKAEVATLTGSATSAEALLTEYHRRGYIDQVRQGLWVAVGLDDSQPVASRYEIATAINPGAYVSHHSAFAYHGYANQVSYEVGVTSATRFTPFEYDDVRYRWLAPRITAGVDAPSPRVRVTDMERTVLDSINDANKVGGLEELLVSLDAVPYLDVRKLTSYLGSYCTQVLYQKTGYLLGLFNTTLRLPESFFADCHSHTGKSVRYLDQGLPSEERTYDRRWQLVVPRHPLSPLNQGAT